jgi:hypothetical protein
VAIVEVPAIEVEGRGEASDQGVEGEGEEKRSEGVPLLHPLLGGDDGGAAVEGGVLTVREGSPAGKCGGVVGDSPEHGGTVDGVEGIGAINLEYSEGGRGREGGGDGGESHGDRFAGPREHDPTLVGEHRIHCRPDGWQGAGVFADNPAEGFADSNGANTGTVRALAEGDERG